MTDEEYKQLLSKRLLRLDEVAILMEVTVRTVSRWVSQGRIEVVGTPGGRRRVVLESLRPYL